MLLNALEHFGLLFCLACDCCVSGLGLWMTSLLWSLPEAMLQTVTCLSSLLISNHLCLYSECVCFDGKAWTQTHTHQQEEEDAFWCQALQNLASPSQSKRDGRDESLWKWQSATSEDLCCVGSPPWCFRTTARPAFKAKSDHYFWNGGVYHEILFKCAPCLIRSSKT